jgi:hypothetical protein
MVIVLILQIEDTQHYLKFLGPEGFQFGDFFSDFGNLNIHTRVLGNVMQIEM